MHRWLDFLAVWFGNLILGASRKRRFHKDSGFLPVHISHRARPLLLGRTGFEEHLSSPNFCGSRIPLRTLNCLSHSICGWSCPLCSKPALSPRALAGGQTGFFLISLIIFFYFLLIYLPCNAVYLASSRIPTSSFLPPS